MHFYILRNRHFLLNVRFEGARKLAVFTTWKLVWLTFSRLKSATFPI